MSHISIRNQSQGLTWKLVGPLLAALVSLAFFFVPAGSAGAATTACTQPDGFEIRATWTRNGGSVVDVTNLQMRSSPSAAWTNYTDTWGRVSKLEWWSLQTIGALNPGSGTGWIHPAVTLFGNQDGYDDWYAGVDQRAAVLSTNVDRLGSPRVSTRDNGSALDRDADICDVFLSDWPNDNAGPRVGIIGDSITVQMTNNYNDDYTDWREFVEPQSGMSFASMQGEARGIAAGLRNPSNDTQTKPDVFVISLGTNDASGIANQPTPQARANALTGFGWVFARVMIDTDDVECRVLTTVHESGWVTQNGQEVYRPELKEARQDVNAMIRDAAQASDVDVVDWAQMSATHGWHSPSSGVSWFYPGDSAHPNDLGLAQLSSAVHNRALNCG